MTTRSPQSGPTRDAHVEALLRAQRDSAIEPAPAGTLAGVRTGLSGAAAPSGAQIAWGRMCIGVALPAAAVIALMVALWSPIVSRPAAQPGLLSQLSVNLEQSVGDVKSALLIEPTTRLEARFDAERQALVRDSRRLAREVLEKLPVQVSFGT